MNTRKVIRVGHSAAVTIPKTMLPEPFHPCIGDSVIVERIGNSIIITKISEKQHIS